jgi:branched-chain amino acid transport system permease protein
MQAIADDVEGSRGVGVRVTTTLALTWGLAAAAAGISGYFLGNIVGINPPNMPVYAFKAFVVMLLGGLQSVGGALIAGPIIGIVEHLGGAYLDPILGGGVKGMLPFLVAIIILTIRPQGLFGWKTIERV